MIYRALADALALIHAAFVLFVIFGGLFAIRWHRAIWAHIPAAVWGVVIEYTGWICPLTPIENALRHQAGEAGYSGGFVEHYVLRALYPSGLTRAIGFMLGTVVLCMNILIYFYIWRHRRARGDLER
ncbi:MAG TPA: DUF2784 domain-containing protein [Gemmatimonadaceae bacterium]|jgi:hypothetical protein